MPEGGIVTEYGKYGTVRKILLYAALGIWTSAAALTFRTFVQGSAYVSGQSMRPTYITGDAAAYTPGRLPERYECAVFTAAPYGETCIKRIYGLPGETVEIRKGVLYINGKETDDPFSDGKTDFGPLTLGKDEYFAMGDNRTRSTDSRSAEAGTVNRYLITGTVRKSGYGENG